MQDTRRLWLIGVKTVISKLLSKIVDSEFCIQMVISILVHIQSQETSACLMCGATNTTRMIATTTTITVRERMLMRASFCLNGTRKFQSIRIGIVMTGIIVLVVDIRLHEILT